MTLQDTLRQALEFLTLRQLLEVLVLIHLFLHFRPRKKLELEYLMLQQIDLTETGPCSPIIQA